ncbi:MAG: type VI secretion system tube protein Hcp [Kiloniellales bacterium]|nr:type VI secretion system tube protein Hcp [Kiloniellales bacterium]
MAVDIFLKIKGIEGESKDAKHKGDIDILGFSWGASQSGTMHGGGGGGSGKVSVQDVSFSKYVDKASPNLIAYLCSGKHVDEATLIVRKAGDKPVEYLKFKMTGVLISSFSTGGSGGDDRLTETFCLNFKKFEVSYTPQAEDGTAGAEIAAGWDIAANEAA